MIELCFSSRSHHLSTGNTNFDYMQGYFLTENGLRPNTSSSGEKVEETEWFNIVVWRQLAEICERYLHKGSKVYLEGRLSQRKYTDREGVKRTSVEVIASHEPPHRMRGLAGGPHADL